LGDTSDAESPVESRRRFWAPRTESDGTPARFRRRHELSDGIEHDSELLVVSSLERSEFPGEIGVGAEYLAQPHERPHDLDVDANGAIALEYA
jgi:hypothetical protein